MRLSRVEKLNRQRAAAKASERPQQETTDVEGLISRIVGGPVLPTQRDFILSPERRGWFTGPVGSAKTTSGIASVILPAMFYPGSRWGVFRSTFWTLEQTTMADFIEALNRLGPNMIVDKVVGPPTKIWIASALRDDRGRSLEPSEILFHGLDDFQKLGGTKFTGIYVDEVNEIEENMATTLDQRLRLKRPGQERAVGPFFWRGTSNPVRRSHWLHKKFCNEEDCEPVPWGKKFQPKPKENEMNLPPGYYDTIAQGLSPEMYMRMVKGECGPDPMGLPVFPEWQPSLHVAQLSCDVSAPVIRSWDFGRRRPCVVWAQRLGSHINRLLVEMGDNEMLEAFADRILTRSSYEFPRATKWLDFCDPHGTAKRDTSDKSSIQILNDKGIRPTYRDVLIQRGIDAMSKGLVTLSNGRPVSQYDRFGARLLIDGYGGGYTWPEPKPGKAMKEKPVADGFYEHPMDCDRYLMVNLTMGSSTQKGQHRTNLRKGR